ncbi:hypothetical protein PybrP1_004462 [[Pythium] brassicae (nom. inval.)]|nr:hypothetical protein PybrP1_004462 [[Pythium] brassicae (nom. inval.)]
MQARAPLFGQPAPSSGQSERVAGAASNEVLLPWELYVLAGAKIPAPDDEMRELFARFRVREEVRNRRHSIGAFYLAASNATWMSGHTCLADALEGCVHCRSTARRPTYDEWVEAVAETALDEQTRLDFGRYKRSYSELLRAAKRGGGTRRVGRCSGAEPRQRSRSRSPDRRSRVPRDGWHQGWRPDERRPENRREEVRPDSRDGQYARGWQPDERWPMYRHEEVRPSSCDRRSAQYGRPDEHQPDTYTAKVGGYQLPGAREPAYAP